MSKQPGITDRRNVAMGGNTKDRPRDQIKRLARHWSATNGGNTAAFENHWPSVGFTRAGGYMYTILRDGTIEWNYDYEKITNGVGDHNSDTVHVCLVGTTDAPPTVEQEESWQWLANKILNDVPTIETIDSHVLGHNEFPNTNRFNHRSNLCPGVNMSEVRANLANYNKPDNQVTPKEVHEPEATGRVLHLPASAGRWRIYDLNGPYTTGNEIGFLRPDNFDGLNYDILDEIQSDVYKIRTRDFGDVAIFAGSNTSAWISTGTESAPTQAQNSHRELHLPASAGRWNIYDLNGPYTNGNQIGRLNPGKFNGLSYTIYRDIIPGTVFEIHTRDWGPVAIWAPPGESSARIT